MDKSGQAGNTEASAGDLTSILPESGEFEICNRNEGRDEPMTEEKKEMLLGLEVRIKGKDKGVEQIKSGEDGIKMDSNVR
jgi:hypothetical protein